MEKKILNFTLNNLNLDYTDRFTLAYKRYKGWAKENPYVFGHILDHLRVPNKQTVAVLKLLKNKKELTSADDKLIQDEKQYTNLIQFIENKRLALKIKDDAGKLAHKEFEERFKELNSKYENFANRFPLTFNNIVETFDFRENLFVNSDDTDKLYYKKRMEKYKLEINNEFIMKLLNEAKEVLKYSKELDDYSADQRYKKLKNKYSTFHHEHPIVFKYISELREFDDTAFIKYAKMYIKSGTNRKTTAELGANYIIYLRKKNHMGPKELAEYRKRLIKDLNKDMQDIDDFSKDFREKYDEKEERILAMQKEDLLSFIHG